MPDDLDPGAPHMDSDDYRQMGLPDSAAVPPAADHQMSPEETALAEQIRTKLREHPQVDDSRIHVVVQSGSVTLTGTSHDRYARQRAEQLAREVEGVKEVFNKIAVQPTDESGGPTLTTRMPGADNEGTTQRS